MTFKRLIGLLFGAMAVIPLRAGAQLSVSAGCSPGIPNCASLRFFLAATGGTSIDQLFITMLTPSARFVSGSVPTIGTYSAEDSFGPYGGFSTISNGGATAAINFLDNGFPFETLDGATGTLDLEDHGVTDPNGLYYTASGVLDDGETFSVTVTPEPSSVLLLSTGFLGIAAMRRRRTKARAT